MGVATSGMILNLAYQMTEDSTYLDTSRSNLHYLLGNNAMGECFVTGYGTVSPEHPHHRPSMAKNQAMKGMLVGGVNSGLEDSAAKAYCANSPSAKCYVDHWESYSTNEITIYWNSPLTCLLAMNSTARTPGHDDIISGDVNQDQTVNTADVVLLQKYLLGEVSLTETQAKAADVQANNTVNGFDLAVLRQKLVQKDDKDDTKGNEPSADAEVLADFRKGATSLFEASDGWTNGNPFDCGWTKNNTSFDNGVLNLTIDKDSSGQYNYTGAEYRSLEHYHYGYYETSMKAIKNDGVVSSFLPIPAPRRITRGMRSMWRFWVRIPPRYSSTITPMVSAIMSTCTIWALMHQRDITLMDSTGRRITLHGMWTARRSTQLPAISRPLPARS